MAPKSIYEKILQAENSSTIQEIQNKEFAKQIRVHMPCKVINVNESTVDVEIQGAEDSGFGYFVKFPLLLDIPIVYNSYTSKAYIVTPVQVGDTGLVEFLDFNASSFSESGKSTISSDSFPHALNNGVFINGYIPANKLIDIPKGKPLVIGLRNKTFTMTVSDTGDLIINTVNSAIIKADIGITLDTPMVNCTNSLGCGSGASGVFQAGNKSVTVADGIITSIS